jgi:hypothetical protein
MLNFVDELNERISMMLNRLVFLLPIASQASAQSEKTDHEAVELITPGISRVMLISFL